MIVYGVGVGIIVVLWLFGRIADARLAAALRERDRLDAADSRLSTNTQPGGSHHG